METDQKAAEKKKMYLGIIVALLLIVGVSLYFVYSGHKDNTDLTAQKTQLEAEFKNLSDTLAVRNTEIGEITELNTELYSTVTASQALIETEKQRIAGLLTKVKMSKAELAEAKKSIEQFQTSIADLQGKLLELTTQNQVLKQDNEKLVTDLDTEKKTSAELNEKNVVLAKKVEVGSLLQLTNIEVAGVKQKQNGKDRITKNAKATESLRISFETGSNKILPTGPLSLYIRIINPKGETSVVATQGSGILQLAGSVNQVQYSKKADIDWRQSSKKVDVYWSQNISTAGTYKVEVYQSGYIIGKGEVILN